jgi:hypothetical protein
VNVCAKPQFKAEFDLLVTGAKRKELLIALEEFLAANPFSESRSGAFYVKQISDLPNNRNIFAYYTVKEDTVFLESAIAVTNFISDELGNVDSPAPLQGR